FYVSLFLCYSCVLNISSLSLRAALPISKSGLPMFWRWSSCCSVPRACSVKRSSIGCNEFNLDRRYVLSRERSVQKFVPGGSTDRSEEHTSELQSRENLVCRLLLEKKNTK